MKMNDNDESFVEEEEFLQLSLSTQPTTTTTPPLVVRHPMSMPSMTMPIPPSHHHQEQHQQQEQQEEAPVAPPVVLSRPPRGRRYPKQKLGQGKTDTVPAPYPWATTRRATVHSLERLLSKGITVITGRVQCKRCEQQYEMEYDLKPKFLEIANFVSRNRAAMHDRAPNVWTSPSLPNCKLCGNTNCMKPVMEKKKSINWLFLFLGQSLGCLKLTDLKYFCKHTKNHRTGAKDRVLYLTYLAMCKQLDPNGPFDP